MQSNSFPWLKLIILIFLGFCVYYVYQKISPSIFGSGYRTANVVEDLIEVNDESFNQDVLQERRPVLVYFYDSGKNEAEKKMLPVLDELAKEFGSEVKFCKYQVRKDNQIWKNYISYMGTLVVFKDGEKVKESFLWAQVEFINRGIALWLLEDWLWPDISFRDRWEKGAIELTDNGFQYQIDQSDKITLVVFKSEKCQASQTFLPAFKEIAKEYNGVVKFFYADIIQSPNLKEKYKIEFTPTLIVFKNGAEIERLLPPIAQDGEMNKITIFGILTKYPPFKEK